MPGKEQVEYELSLRDMLTGKLHVADGAAKGLETTMSAIEKIAGGLGIGLGIFAGFEFLKGAKEEFHGIEQANAQLQAGLTSTRGVAGLTMEELDKQAKQFDRTTLFSRQSLKDTQSLLLTFPAVTKVNFDQATQSILDMSTRLKEDPKDAAIQLGKALQDPVRGITALHRVGVNFSEQQKAQVAQYLAHGNMLAAQTLILKEVTTEFGGSAKAAFDADPEARYEKTMEDLRIKAGELAEKFEVTLLPALTWIADKVSEGVDDLEKFGDWINDHQDQLKHFGEAVYVVGGAWAAYFVTVKSIEIWEAAKFAIQPFRIALNWYMAGSIDAMTAAQWALNIAMEANPIGLVTGAVAGLALVLKQCYDNTEDMNAAFDKTGNKIHWDPTIQKLSKIQLLLLESKDGALALAYTLKGISEWLYDRNLAEVDFAIARAASDEKAKIGRGEYGKEDEYTAQMEDIAKAKDYGPKSVMKDQYNNENFGNAFDEFGRPTFVKTVAKTGKQGGGNAGAELTNVTSKASGTKAITVNITINGGLINTLKFAVTTMTESYHEVEKHVARAVTNAVNQGQIVAGE